jgi:IS66 C-terminal element
MRKNWLFAGSDAGGERAAAIYMLLGTAKFNDLNPESYLRYVLERIADHLINQIEELLPWSLLLKPDQPVNAASGGRLLGQSTARVCSRWRHCSISMSRPTSHFIDS